MKNRSQQNMFIVEMNITLNLKIKWNCFHKAKQSNTEDKRAQGKGKT